MTQAPLEHRQEALKLGDADALVDLFTARLKTGTIYRFWNGPTRTYRGQIYNGLACQMSGEKVTSDGEVSRPLLSIANPENAFSGYAAAGFFDMAEVVRYRLLQDHFLNDIQIWEQRVWIATRVASIKNQILTLELRSPLDLPNFKVPARTYNPPEFPAVSI